MSLLKAVSMLMVVGTAGAADVETLPPAVVADDSAAEHLGYVLGYQIGSQIVQHHRGLGVPIDFDAMARGLGDAVTGDGPPRLDEATFKRVLAEFDRRMEERERQFLERMAAAAKANLEKGSAFLAANAAKPGVTTLPSGLQYEVLTTGSGVTPTKDDVVIAHYRGLHVDGSEFDGTEATAPASFPVRRVVPGWQEALPLMAVGSKWRIVVPPDLGYGAEGSPPKIEPNEVLVFEIELVGIEANSPTAR